MAYDLLFNLGTLEIGSTISSFLLGISTSQAYTYYQRYHPQDRLRTRLLVLVVWLLEVCHTIATIQSFFIISIVYYNDPDRIFAKAAPGYVTSVLLSGLIASIVQVYFADRIRCIAEQLWLAVLCWLLSFLRFAGTIVLAVLFFTKSLDEFNAQYRPVAIAIWLVGALVDLLIAVSLVVNLIKKRKEAMMGKRLLDAVIIMVIQTGVVTSMTTMAVTICFIVMPNTFVWGAVGAALAKVFSISLFASLNAREKFRRDSMFDVPSIHLLQGLDVAPRAREVQRMSALQFAHSDTLVRAESVPPQTVDTTGVRPEPNETTQRALRSFGQG